MLRFEALGYSQVWNRLGRRARQVSLVVPTVAKQVAPVVLQFLRQEAPKRSGQFAGGLQYHLVSQAGKTEVVFAATGLHAFLAGLIIGGTLPHPIRGKPVLHWLDGNEHRFARWVQHPGTKPNPFPARALRRAQPAVQAEFRRHVRGLAFLTGGV